MRFGFVAPLRKAKLNLAPKVHHRGSLKKQTSTTEKIRRVDQCCRPPGALGTGPDPVIDQGDKAPESCTNAGHESTMYFRDQRYKRNRSVSIRTSFGMFRQSFSSSLKKKILRFFVKFQLAKALATLTGNSGYPALDCL